jgi:hypothetical protein
MPFEMVRLPEIPAARGDGILRNWQLWAALLVFRGAETGKEGVETADKARSAATNWMTTFE